jgi:hypothetical protein
VERESSSKVHIDSPRSPGCPSGVKTIKKFPLLSKNYVINEENSTVMGISDQAIIVVSEVAEPPDQREFRFPTNPKKRVVIEPTFITTTSINIIEHYQVPSAITTTTTTTAPSKPPRIKENTPLGVYENKKTLQHGKVGAKELVPFSKQPPQTDNNDVIKEDIEYHYGVRNAQSGDLDVYAKPVPSGSVKIGAKKSPEKPEELNPKLPENINPDMTGNLKLIPPELPKRNSPP